MIATHTHKGMGARRYRARGVQGAGGLQGARRWMRIMMVR